MNRRYGMMGVFVLAAAVTAGCAKKEDEANEYADTTTVTPAPAPPAAVDTGMPTAPVVVQLQDVGGSGVSGQATATHSPTDVTVAIRVNGAKGTADYPAHIHNGTCASGGPVAVELTAVKITNGVGESTTTVETSKLNPAQPSFVQVHEPGPGNGGKPVACGDMPGHGQ